MSDDKGATTARGASAAQSAPRLRSGADYSAWAPSMDVFLQRAGAEGIHKKATTAESWEKSSTMVGQWAEEEYEQALALLASAPMKTDGGASSGTSGASVLRDDVKHARKIVSSMVERSHKVFGIVYEALPDDVRMQAESVPRGWAYGLWHWLEAKYQSTEEDRVGDLLAQWTALQQGDEESFDAYAARVDKLKALLAAAKEKPSERMYAYMLLDRLQPRYKPAVLALKASGTALKDAVAKESWEHVKAFINTHERNEQRIDAADGASGSKAMSAHGYKFKRGQRSDQRPRRPLSEVKCFNCGKFGHYQNKCPTAQRSGDAPSNSTPTPPGAPGPIGSAKCVLAVGGDADDSAEDNGDAASPQFTYAAVQPAAANAPSEPSAVAGDRVASARGISAALATTAWGVDSMASMHVSGNRKQFKHLRKVAPVQVEVADGSLVPAQYQGSVKLKLRAASGKAVRVCLKNVYFHERFAANLLSWGTLRLEGWQLHSAGNETYTITPDGVRINLSTQGRVAVLEQPEPQRAFLARRGRRELTDAASLLRVHEKLGHVGFDTMLQIVKSGATLDVGHLSMSDAELKEARRLVHECKACTQGKGSRRPFGDSGVDRGTAPAEVLHMDTYYVKVQHGGETRVEYGLTVVDPYTEHRWFAHTSSKDAIAKQVVDIVRVIRTQLGHAVKRLHADGGSEFINDTVRAFCAKEGIEVHYPPARTQQLNGVAERSVRSCKDAARTLLLQSGLDDRFWWRAALHATYVWNRTHIGRATGVTPYESMRGKKPSVRHLGVFGCDSFCHVPKAQRTALQPKMIPCVYLGHESVQNCAMVWILELGKVVASRDVVFRPSSFSHAHALAAGRAALDQLLAKRDSADEAAHASQGGMEPLLADASDDSELEWDVERIMDKRERGGKVEYCVKWLGYGEDEATWEPEEHVLEGCQQLVDEFEAAQVSSEEADDSEQAGADNEPASEPEQSAGSAEPAAPPAAELQAAPAPRAVRESRRLRGFAPQCDAGAVMVALSAIRAMQPTEDADADPNGPKGAELLMAVKAGTALLEENTPQRFEEAIESDDAPQWRAAMDKEMSSCEALQVWELVPRASLPKGTNVLPCKWVYRVKTDELGEVTQYKARLTPKGFRQKEGVDYFEVYARTGMYKTMRIGLSLAAKFDHELEQMDVPTAFLNAALDEDVYMELPQGYRHGRDGMVCKLKKSLYGLKQAPRNWYLLITRFLAEALGFKATVSDPCLFHKRSQSGQLMLLFLWVDDLQGSFHRDDRAEWAQCKQLLKQRFNVKDMGESKWILGMRIQRNRAARTISLDQELYVTKALERYGLVQCKVAPTPEVTGSVEQLQPQDGADDMCDRHLFMEKVGTLMYAAISTRPDIAHAVHVLACRMQAPTKRWMVAVDRVLRYLAGTRDLGLVFGSRNGDAVSSSRGRSLHQVDVCAYADADWANDKADRKSITGWVAKLNGDPISWSCTKQRSVALSTCEAELYAQSSSVQEVLWVRGLMKELTLHFRTGSSTVHGDNQSTLSVAKNGVRSSRTKHVDIKYAFLTESVERGDVELKWVPTTEQQADIFTKALPAPLFEHHRRELMTR